MTRARGHAVIVGGGMSGLFSALLLSDLRPDLQLHLVEKAAELGGGHGSFFDPEGGCFDHGMHLMFDSLVPEVDRYYLEMMPEEDWIILSGNRKDIAGIYHAGNLLQDSPYMDLRQLAEPARGECAAGLLQAMAEAPAPASACDSAEDFFRRRFGAAVAEKMVEPVLQKLWRRSGRELDAMATRIVLMDRVLLFDAPAMTDLMKSDRIRARIGFPKQMETSPAYRSAQRGYYPRRYGMYRVAEAAARKLAARGVKLHLGSEVSDLKIEGGRLHGLRIGAEQLDAVELLHWTIPLPALAPQLGVKLAAPRLDPALPQAHVYFLLRRPPSMGELYSFYCFDPGFASFRVTNYAAYCPDARRSEGRHAGTYPVCVELHFDPGAQPDEAHAARVAAGELARMGVISGPEDIAYTRAVPARIGFPLLTRNNTAQLAGVRRAVEERLPANLLVAGFAPERGVFFVHDVLEQNYLGLRRCLEAR
jgi:phytoene dehydrogenase-like protein